jgi:SNF2 family DNA or RNA helicase
VLISNYAASAHEPFKSWSTRQRFNYVAYDECHRLRSPGGVWSRWAAKMHAHADRHLGGTGTLQAQSPLDVFGQVRAVEPGIFGSTYIGFERRYAIKGGFEGRVVVDYQNEDELAAKLAEVTYHAGEEVLDLPEMMPDLDVEGRLSPRAMRAYRDLEQDMYAEVQRTLESGQTITEEATADNVLVRILRCMQMTGGHLQFDSGVLEQIDTAKADLLFEELSDLPRDEPVVVFAKFLPDLDNIARVAAALDDGQGRPYAELSGRRSDALAEDATLSPNAVIAGVQIQAGGTGVDFTRSAFGYYYSVGYSLGDYLQSRKRLQRPGQTRSVRFRHLVMQNTIDEEVYEALAARQSVVERIAGKVKALQAAGGLR